MGFFFRRENKATGSGAERSFAKTYDKEKVKPAIRCSICTDFSTRSPASLRRSR